MDVKLVIVRHGETAFNRQHIIQGHLDVPLNDNGRIQAFSASLALKQVEFDAAYSSDLSRAFETAEIILANNKTGLYGGIWKCYTLRERGTGVMQGQSSNLLLEEAKDSGIPAYMYTPEGGETLEMMTHRAALFFEDLCEDIKLRWKVGQSPTILIASHGGLIKDLLVYLVERKGCGLPTLSSAEYRGISPNCGVTRLTLKMDTELELKSMHITDLYNGKHLRGIDLMTTKNHHLSSVSDAPTHALRIRNDSL
eukprot:maker-scaffold348_size200312-snap-gene-0.25 protein:Tk10896 transcript:maker-scaffold348_size200312-snap-gene-0.25-mRNA-1 annotation:"probable fructose- -bisphosphatase tigar-like"